MKNMVVKVTKHMSKSALSCKMTDRPTGNDNHKTIISNYFFQIVDSFYSTILVKIFIAFLL